MDINTCAKLLLILCVEIARSGELSASEDDFLSLDLAYPSDSEDGLGLFQPGVLDLTVPPRAGITPYDVDETVSEPAHVPKHHRRHHSKRQRTEPDFSSSHRHPQRFASEEDGSRSDPDLSVTPVDLRAIIWKPDSVARVKRCRREITAGGTSWNETECIKCECRASEVQCHRPQCPTLECKNQVQPDGECCPTCPEKLCETEDGRRFEHGAEWHRDDCTYCECRKGKILCSVEDCHIPNCNSPVKVPGQCCPICLDMSCHASNGTRITAGEVWKEGICTHCYCAGGERKCAQEKCPFINCTARHRPNGKCCERCDEGVVNCIESSWGSWTECPIQECGGGMRRRYRSVLIPHRNGGSFCPHLSEAETCPRLPCDVVPVCPVTDWTPWGHCTATCGSGRKMRSRERAPTTKATMTSLIDCSTTHLQETAHCYVGACLSPSAMLDPEDPVHDDVCYDVTWSEWGVCSSECGTGVQKRHQVLINASHPRGHLCHLLDEVRTCQGQSCTGTADKGAMVRCKVSPWGEWSTCTKTCGPGAIKTKYRTVLQKPSGGARSCPRLYVSKPCKTRPCPSKLFFGSLCFADNGQIYSGGETWMEGSCKSCTCTNSHIHCKKVACGR